MTWPASSVKLAAAYLAREPAPDERIEFAIAHLHQETIRRNGVVQNTVPDLKKILLFFDPWGASTEGRYSEADLQMLSALATFKAKKK